MTLTMPAELLKLHQDVLSKPLNRAETIDSKLFEQWSIHLALFLNQSKSDIEANLRQLYKTYQSSNVKTCLEVVNQFCHLPGYPFLREKNFSEHINYACHFFNLAREKIIPKIPIFAFHKTASSFVSVVLCQLFDILPSVLSFNHQQHMPAWANAFSKWGGVIHDHYFPSTSNLNTLYEAGIKKCIIHHRHPVDTLISLAFHEAKNNPSVSKDTLADEAACIAFVRNYLDREMELLIHYHSIWLHSWRKEAESGRMEIMETTYEDMKTDQKKFFIRILNYNQIKYDEKSLENVLADLREKQSNNYNFRKATTNEWQEILTPNQIEKMKLLINREFPDVYF